MSITFSLIKTEDDQYVTVFAPGRDPLPASSSHPNFEAIVAGCVANMRLEDDAPSADDIADLFDIGATVSRKFARLSERVTVNADGIMLDGDPVHGVLQDQILDFLDAGQDFGPLVHFYEKLTTNPLGDVRDGLYEWITGQTAEGRKLTITSEGNIIGYKSVKSASPEWRTDETTVYVPSRRGPGTVNGIDVEDGKYIEQVPGDVVEMPRSKVLHAPSTACGDGLHIGTYEYAHSFYGGNTVMAVEFSPRDIVSLPDRNSTWKLRVCRYTVLGPVTEPYAVPVFLTEAKPEPVEDGASSTGFKKGDRVRDLGDDLATVLEDQDDDTVRVKYDDRAYSQDCYQDADAMEKIEDEPAATTPETTDLTFEDECLRVGDRVVDADGDEGTIEAGTYGRDLTIRYDDSNVAGDGWLPTDVDEDGSSEFVTKTRSHGKGGLTSQSAKGRNPHQDEKGRFVSGRPGSTRNASTGRFA